MSSESASNPAPAPSKPSYSTDPALYIYTSLTAGSSHIVTATSRLETILRANKVPFKAIDLATDEKARMLWGRRSGKDESGRVRKLPGLVQEGTILGVGLFPSNPPQPRLTNPITPPTRTSSKSKTGTNTASSSNTSRSTTMNSPSPPSVKSPKPQW